MTHQAGATSVWYVQTIPKHPLESASAQTTLVEISYRNAHNLDHVLTPQDFGLAARHCVEMSHGYIRWFYSISHSRMTLPHENVHVLRPPEQEAFDVIVVDQDGEQG